MDSYFILQCNTCAYEIYISQRDFTNMDEDDQPPCPNCNSDGIANWKIVGEGI